MKKKEKTLFYRGLGLMAAFCLWTLMIQTVDVKPAGETATAVGFSALNIWVHQLFGVHMALYTVTDWLGLVPVGVCLFMGTVGTVQLVRRKGILRVDRDILLLGGYYLLVIFFYVFFEIAPIQYRPVLIQGRMEASYPSSTTLLVLSVMPTLTFQCRRRLKNTRVKRTVALVTAVFSGAMVALRLVSGVHWFTDIVGSVLLSAGLYTLYTAAAILCDNEHH